LLQKKFAPAQYGYTAWSRIFSVPRTRTISPLLSLHSVVPRYVIISVMSHKTGVITRFPPSPTGLLHIGSVRTALFNYLFAKKDDGKMLFRVEDTDTLRSKKEFEDDIVRSLEWLGLTWDNKEIVRQSERNDVYKKYLKKLIDEGKAFVSKETPKEPGGREEVIRFKNANKKIAFDDLIRGTIEFDTTELGDFIIAKSLDEPLYHLAVVIDDFEAGVTHVIRGEDGISNTPRQILIQEAIGAPRPVYAHLPLVLDAQRAKLSKRKHGEKVSLRYYIEQGYLPSAILNYMALLGWNPGTDQEIFTLPELIQIFDIKKVHKGGAIFDEEKLRWINKEHLKRLAPEAFNSLIKARLPEKFTNDKRQLEKILNLIKERITILSEINVMVESGELHYFFEKPLVVQEKLMWKGESDATKTAARLESIVLLVKAMSEEVDWNTEAIKKAIMPFADKEGRGGVLWPMRVALSGKDKSPDPFTLAYMLGKEETISRLTEAYNVLSKSK